MILKEAGPEIFVQSHSLIIPSGSLDVLPSSETLSVGKVITWSSPAIAMGGLLVSLQRSHDFSFLQEIKTTIHERITKAVNFRFGFMINNFYNLHHTPNLICSHPIVLSSIVLYVEVLVS